jgi:CubicO group peptidase (beta-lactamase class C family)
MITILKLRSGRRAHVALLITMAAAVAASACSTGASRSSAPTPAAVSSPPVFPGAEWERVPDPRTVGWSPAGLQAVNDKLATMSSTGFMAIVGGRVLMQYGNVDTVSYLASVRKSILSMLYGIYIERGRIDLGKTLAQMDMDDLQGLSARERQATTRHLIMARSGIYHPASNAGDDLASAPPRGSQAPGTYFLYNNWDFNAAGAAFEKQTGVDIYDALEQDLAKPLGMRDFVRARHRKSGDTTASRYQAYHINLSTRDMARIGYLMLREGNWYGRQLVPRDWVRESTRALTPVGEMNPTPRRDGPWGYGYLWWVWDGKDNTGPYKGAYTGLGAVGQHITVMPALDLVVVHKTVPRPGKSVSHTQYREVLDLLLNARCAQSC